MQNLPRTFGAYLAAALALPLLAPLAGCGAAKRLVNDNIPAIKNPGSLDGKQFPVPVSLRSRVAVSGTGSFTGSFPDIAAVGQQNRLTFAELTQNLRPELRYVPNPGTPVPSRIVLSDVSLSVSLGDGAGVVPGTTRTVVIPSLRPASGNLVFERVGDSDRYVRNTDNGGEIPLGAVRVSGDAAKRLFTLLTERDNVNQSTNTVTATLSATADAQGVETASGMILLTFGQGVARVGI